MTITVKSVGLPSGYRKMAHITFARRMGDWVTVAHFESQTQGQAGVYFMYEHGTRQVKPKEISGDWYYSLLRRYYAPEPKFPVNVEVGGKEPCRYCGELDCPNPSDCPKRREHIEEDQGKE